MIFFFAPLVPKMYFFKKSLIIVCCNKKKKINKLEKEQNSKGWRSDKDAFFLEI